VTPQDVPSGPATGPYGKLKKRDPNQSPARGTRGGGYDELAGAPAAAWEGAAPATLTPAAPAQPAAVGAKVAAAKAAAKAGASSSPGVGAKSVPTIPKPPVPVEFPPAALRAECEALVARYPQRLAALIPILHLAQRKLGGWISPELEAGIAKYLGCADQHVRGVLTFYTMFNTKPVGRHHVQVCRTLSCWLRGAGELTACLKRTTGLAPGQTDAEGRFTVSEVECLGLCETAPALFVNDDAHVHVTPSSLETLLKSLP